MNRKAYELANEIKTELGTDKDCLLESPSDVEMERYKNNVLHEIRKEKRTGKAGFRRISVAACAALMLFAGTIAFGDEVHAAIRQIGWSLSKALGISRDLADYKEVVNTTSTDKGYVITLQEAVVSEEKLVVNYTLQREDGQPMETCMMPDGVLYVNGKQTTGGGGGSAGFLDEEQVILGAAESWNIDENEGWDLSQENEFELVFSQLGFDDGVKGNWSFAFRASGADLIADTRRVEIARTFRLPDGVTVTLKEYTANDLEQRISYDLSGPTNNLLMVKAVDDTGCRAEFGVRSETENSGYMQNEEVIDDGRLSDTAATAVFTLYAVKLPEEDGRIDDDYIPIGEPFQISLD